MMRMLLISVFLMTNSAAQVDLEIIDFKNLEKTTKYQDKWFSDDCTDSKKGLCSSASATLDDSYFRLESYIDKFGDSSAVYVVKYDLNGKLLHREVLHSNKRIKYFPICSLDLESPVFKDLTGDGIPELLVRYKYEDKVIPGAGFPSHDRLAVFSIHDLRLLWYHSLKDYTISEQGGRRTCSWEVAYDSSRLPRLVATRTCSPAYCPADPNKPDEPRPDECPEPLRRVETYRWKPAEGRYALEKVVSFRTPQNPIK